MHPDPRIAKVIPFQPKKQKRQINPVDELIRSAIALDDDHLCQLQAAIAALIQSRQPESESKEVEEASAPAKASQSQRGYIESKMIRGYGPYLYLRYWSGGKHCSSYLGKPLQK